MRDMKLLFLRGQVPTDRPKEQIMFDSIEACDDVWSQLGAELSKDGYGEIWYWGGNRKVRYRDNLVERWVSSFNASQPKFEPTVIFARGGFPQYDTILNRYPQAFKIYYGAGRRFLPKSPFKKYDLILVDTPKQLAQARKNLPRVRTELFIKPAAENIFSPVPRTKEYDVIFCSNEHKSGIKGHDFILSAFPNDLKMVQLGIASPKLRAQYPNIHFTKWIPRRKIPEYYGKSKIAVICCANVDSCPRIIPEALACNCPILVLDTVNVWRDKYVTPETGEISSRECFIENLIEMISNYKKFEPYNYYKNHLSLQVSANHIRKLMGDKK